MDIITHTLSGLAVGTVAISYSNNSVKEKLKLLALSAFGGALPDLDAISLWSKFDNTIGNFLSLENTGSEIYFAKFWYSHHGFLHSVTAALLIAIFLFIVSHFLKSQFRGPSKPSIVESLKSKMIYLLTFILAFAVHLLEDMPTPASVWGGVNFFWPSESYIGGTGDIWWWNNYDIFLIVLAVVFLNLLIAVFRHFIRLNARAITTAIFMLGFTIAVIQINSRGYDFSYQGYTQDFQIMEAKSKEIQRDILGEELYALMIELDNKIPLNF